MKLNQKEKKQIDKANEKLKTEKVNSHYASETHRADKWTRSNVFRNKKAYTRKQKHKPTY